MWPKALNELAIFDFNLCECIKILCINETNICYNPSACRKVYFYVAYNDSKISSHEPICTDSIQNSVHILTYNNIYRIYLYCLSVSVIISYKKSQSK